MNESTQAAETVKTCCAVLYQSDWIRLLLGDSFHPGGLALTERLGKLLGLGPGARVLDVAAGQGASAIFLAQRFACQVVGVDFGEGMVREATSRAWDAGVSGLVRFERGDAEKLPFEEETFDAVLCECAFCTFLDKRAAAAEVARVLRPGGRIGLSDLTRSGPLPEELESLLAWVACIADARPVSDYISLLEDAGLEVDAAEPHDRALGEMVRDIRTRLLGAELLVALNKIELPGIDLEQSKTTARRAAEAIEAGQLGYVLIAGVKP